VSANSWLSVSSSGKLFVGAKNFSGSIQNQRVSVILAIMYQVDASWGKRVNERPATRAIHVAVQPDAKGCCVGHSIFEKLLTRDFCNIYCYLRLHCLRPINTYPGPSMMSHGLIVVGRTSTPIFLLSHKPASTVRFRQHFAAIITFGE
jgi:hypothetical protein